MVRSDRGDRRKISRYRRLQNRPNPRCKGHCGRNRALDSISSKLSAYIGALRELFRRASNQGNYIAFALAEEIAPGTTPARNGYGEIPPDLSRPAESRDYLIVPECSSCSLVPKRHQRAT